jgi:hypothetical protein
MAIYVRLGCLFYEFKAKPAFCAMYTAIKLGQKVAKGILLGVFYGGCTQGCQLCHDTPA